jgi:glycosyltransferase involved in cell wall biosynthesis
MPNMPSSETDPASGSRLPPPQSIGTPRVSVVVPVYNRGASLRWTLESVLAQSYPSFEVIVVDDGSSDDSAACVASHYPGVRLLRQERNRGAAAAVNRGVAAARGELIAFLDSDDVWSPDKLTLQVEDFDLHPEAVISFTDITYGRSGVGPLYSWLYPLDPERLLEQLMEENPALPSALMVRRGDFERVGGYAEDIGSAFDRDLLLRLAVLGPFRFLPVPLVRRVVRADALSRPSIQFDRHFDLVVERFLGRPEGVPWRAKARYLFAYQNYRIGARRALAGDWRRGLSYIGKGVRQDPLVPFRNPPGRRLVRTMLGSALESAGARLARFAGKRIGAAVEWRLHRLVSRVGLGEPVRPYVPPPGVSFRPPPDAPE